MILLKKLAVAIIPLASLVTFQAVAGEEGFTSLQSFNYPSHYIRHASYRAQISEIHSELDKSDATFKIVDGLADKNCISFQSLNYPGYYLRHRSYEIWLDPHVADDLYEKDATFCERSGLADPSATTFESLNYPGHFIRHRNYKLFINTGSGDLFKADATFWKTSPLAK
ncbi:AbfB domain-containing protein [Zooshikella ganghwensis]|uniref:AbfB domain-containing protein n=1 Tax=Zooshikella ganghwensis TaxID=202772 RepID=UPI0013FD5721|nr:AbfB domain-containing protein [Zooshikella ganghwensis]